MKTVAHFTRQFLNLTETFIRNQIDNHIEFKPVIIFKEKILSTPHYKYIAKKFITLNIEKKSRIFPDFKYQYLRQILKKDEKKILEFINKTQPYILHFHYGTDAGMYADIIKKVQIPSVVSFYGYDCSGFPKRYFGYGKNFLMKKVFTNITKVLAMSPDMQNDLIAIGCPKEKIIVHYYGTDIQKFLFKSRRYEKKETYTLLILASLTPQKGHLFLFKAIKKLVNRNTKNFILRVVGDGFLRKKLQDWVRKNNLSNYINFIGAKPYGSPEMINEFHSTDIFVHPSITASNGDKEGIPGTIIEAMASSLPVISTIHAGIPYIIENNSSGILVKENNVKELANSIENLMNNKSLRKQLGTNAQNYAVKNLDIKIKEKNLEKIYTNLILNSQT